MLLRKSTSSWTKDWICSACHALSTSSKSGQQSLAQRRQLAQKLPSTPARTRFAPSPTGHLHLGSLRTALFSYLLAKATGGKFVLRIEDTDQSRTVPGAEERICRDLEWAGLRWDEGPEIGGPYGPYKQSERTALYQEHAYHLIDSGSAYRCFCTPERLNDLARRRSQLGLPTDYDRACADLTPSESMGRASGGEPHTVRLRVPDIYPEYSDLVYGLVGKQNRNTSLKYSESAYEDPILLKSDGLPTYHLANVVDDHTMEISHVIRAVEWMPSTPKHLMLYNAFGWKPPNFAHVGLLQDISRQKLSKRNMDLDIRSFDRDGIFPEALVNYVALLGWSHTLGSDVLSLPDLIKNFNLKFTKGNTVVDFKKLLYLQAKHAQKYSEEDGAMFESLVDRVFNTVREHLQAQPEGTVLQITDLKSYVAAILRLDAQRYTTPQDFLQRNSYFFCPLIRSDYIPISNSVKENFPDNILSYMRSQFVGIPVDAWTASRLKETLGSIKGSMWETLTQSGEEKSNDNVAEQKSTGKSLIHYLRWAISGGCNGPGIPDTMALLGRDVSLERLEEASVLLDNQRSKSEGIFRGERPSIGEQVLSSS